MESLPLPITDIIVVIILIIGAFNGYRKGFVVSIASLIAIIAGGLAAFFLSTFVGGWLNSFLDWTSSQIVVASFALTFILVVIGVHLLAKALEKFLKLAALGFINKIAGSVLGILKNSLIISFIIYGLSGFHGVLPKDFGEGCIVYPHVESLASEVFEIWDKNKSKLTEEEKIWKYINDR
ncbi:MAG: hypothetical protein CL847_03735 [Crocinitomicaceae bacterium]|nr:hypothetical protein [Crocinitomicaceae bacterium]|tara:strand:+ start:3801 stop:4340 length:540 start_codon:yes stop_codon:yes gene_type:complete